MAPVERKSERGRRLRDEAVLSPIDQIRQIPGGNGVDATGAWAYYIRPDGATIRDALILCPNGGIPEMDNERLRNRYGTNAEYYRNRQRAKGWEFIGPHLREQGVRRLLEVLEANRDDEILFLEEEIAEAKDTIKNSDMPDVRGLQKRRVRQLERRLDTIRQGFDPDELTAELNEIARAQQLAMVPPAVLRVMRSMIGDVNDRMVDHFAQGKSRGESAPGRLSASGSDRGEGIEGRERIDL
jgi:hypothetical protein